VTSTPISPAPSPGAACGTPVCSAIPLVLRLVLGGLFILAGISKLQNPAVFGGAIYKFDLGLAESQIKVLAFAIPWTEIITGTLLVLGLMTRGAALVLLTMLAGFTFGIVRLIAAGKSVDCGCFGQLKLFCGDAPLGACHLIRNGIMMAAALVIMVMGPGRLYLDRCERRLRRARDGQCIRCGYDRAGLPPIACCPECGDNPRA
jgi:uncharacterized membrane protein YphA (DoxX/SURF4 family)